MALELNHRTYSLGHHDTKVNEILFDSIARTDKWIRLFNHAEKRANRELEPTEESELSRWFDMMIYHLERRNDNETTYSVEQIMTMLDSLEPKITAGKASIANSLFIQNGVINIDEVTQPKPLIVNGVNLQDLVDTIHAAAGEVMVSSLDLNLNDKERDDLQRQGNNLYFRARELSQFIEGKRK